MFGEEREFLFPCLTSVFLVSEAWWAAAHLWLEFGCCPWGAYSLNVKRQSLVYTRGVSNDCGWVALTIRTIVVVERHFKEEARKKEKRMYGMQRVNANEGDKWGDYY